MTETNPLTMNIGHEYAGLLYQSGRFANALDIYQRVLSATRKVFDDENRDTIATLHNIAVAGHLSLEITACAAVESAVAIPVRRHLWSPFRRGNSRMGPS